jgi:hypothetical protein
MSRRRGRRRIHPLVCGAGTTIGPPLRHRSPRKRTYGKKYKEFTGERTDTKPKKIITTKDGRRYILRKDHSLYPQNSSIPVSLSIQFLYNKMNLNSGYNNYDELLLDLAERWFRSKHHMNESRVAEFEKLIAKARFDCNLKTSARNTAIEKYRYFFGETYFSYDPFADTPEESTGL